MNRETTPVPLESDTMTLVSKMIDVDIAAFVAQFGYHQKVKNVTVLMVEARDQQPIKYDVYAILPDSYHGPIVKAALEALPTKSFRIISFFEGRLSTSFDLAPVANA